VRFAKEEHSICLTLFSPTGMTDSSTQNVSSTSMNWGAASPCSVTLCSSLGCLLDVSLGLGGLASAVTSTGTSLIPQDRFWGSHSITLAVFVFW